MSLSQIDALTEVVAAVKGKMEVYLDGGIRTGNDVLKALALGAKCVFLGRPILWGLAYKVRDTGFLICPHTLRWFAVQAELPFQVPQILRDSSPLPASPASSAVRYTFSGPLTPIFPSLLPCIPSMVPIS